MSIRSKLIKLLLYIIKLLIKKKSESLLYTTIKHFYGFPLSFLIDIEIVTIKKANIILLVSNLLYNKNKKIQKSSSSNLQKTRK